MSIAATETPVIPSSKGPWFLTADEHDLDDFDETGDATDIEWRIEQAGNEQHGYSVVVADNIMSRNNGLAIVNAMNALFEQNSAPKAAAPRDACDATCTTDCGPCKGAGPVLEEDPKSELDGNVIDAKQNDPREYGYLLAKAGHPTENFRKTVRQETDLTRKELLAEGWNEFQEEAGHEDRCISL